MSDILVRSFCSVLLVVLACISMPLLAATEVRTYRMDNRTAADVAEQIRELYSDSPISVTAQGQQMMVRGEPRLLDEIGKLVETMDVAPSQVRVTIRSRSNLRAKHGGGGVSAEGNQANVQAERKVTTTRRNEERSVVVQEGHSAHITSGQVRTVPIAIRGGRNPAAILSRIETRSGFLVSPQVISDQMVELSVMSFEDDPDNDIAGYETEAVMTIRRVDPGEWVELGSVSSQQAENRSGITYRAGGDRQQNQTFEVRIDIL